MTRWNGCGKKAYDTRHRTSSGKTCEGANEADSLAYQMEKLIKESGDKMAANDRSALEAKVSELRRVMEGNDAGRIREVIEELKQASYAVSQQMYGQQPGAGPQAAGTAHGTAGAAYGEAASGDDDVVDGEFREV